MRVCGHHSPWTYHRVAVLGDQEALDTCLCPPLPNPSSLPFQDRIWPPEILYTNKIVTNLHRRWGMSGSGCHGDHLPGPAVSASPEQLRHQEILPVSAAGARPPALQPPRSPRRQARPGGRTAQVPPSCSHCGPYCSPSHQVVVPSLGYSH